MKFTFKINFGQSDRERMPGIIISYFMCIWVEGVVCYCYSTESFLTRNVEFNFNVKIALKLEQKLTHVLFNSKYKTNKFKTPEEYKLSCPFVICFM